VHCYIASPDDHTSSGTWTVAGVAIAAVVVLLVVVIVESAIIWHQRR